MYVSYSPNAPKPMGPPSIGATPPRLTGGSNLFAAYTDGMSASEVEKFKACMHAKVAAAGDGRTRNEYFAQCRDSVWGVAPVTQPQASAGFSLPPWAIYAGAGAAVFLAVHFLVK